MQRKSNDQFTEREKTVLNEIEEFRREKENVKEIMGKVGGSTNPRRDRITNIVFLIVIIGFFIVNFTTDFLPAFVSIEISILFVSIKIVWMMHAQQRYNHFVFWILNTLEFRINDMTKRIKDVQKNTASVDEEEPDGDNG